MSEKRKSAQPANIHKSEEKLIKERARNLPLDRCYVNDDWEKTKIAHVIVSRKHINGNLTFAMLLVDLALYGVKNVIYKFNTLTDEVDNIVSNEFNSFKEIPYNLAHNITYAGLEWAEDFGFLPHKGWQVAQYILEEDTDNIPLIEVECGIDGKPAIFRNSAIAFRSDIQKLEENAGPGNYTIFDEESDDENEFDEDEDEDDEGEFDEEEDPLIERILDDDLEDYFPEFGKADFDMPEDYFENNPEAQVPFINELHYRMFGQYYLPDIELLDFAIGEKDVVLDNMGISDKGPHQAYFKNKKKLTYENLIADIEKHPDNRCLYTMLYSCEDLDEQMEEDNSFLNFSEKVYKKLNHNLTTTGNYLAQLANHGEIEQFKKLLKQTDFINKVLNYEDDIPEMLFVYFCLVCAHEALLVNKLEEADKYYFAGRIFIGLYDDPAMMMFQIKMIEFKANMIEENHQKATSKSSHLKIIR